jgi:hypothetical protein
MNEQAAKSSLYYTQTRDLSTALRGAQPGRLPPLQHYLARLDTALAGLPYGDMDAGEKGGGGRSGDGVAAGLRTTAADRDRTVRANTWTERVL